MSEQTMRRDEMPLEALTYDQLLERCAASEEKLKQALQAVNHNGEAIRDLIRDKKMLIASYGADLRELSIAAGNCEAVVNAVQRIVAKDNDTQRIVNAIAEPVYALVSSIRYRFQNTFTQVAPELSESWDIPF